MGFLGGKSGGSGGGGEASVLDAQSPRPIPRTRQKRGQGEGEGRGGGWFTDGEIRKYRLRQSVGTLERDLNGKKRGRNTAAAATARSASGPNYYLKCKESYGPGAKRIFHMYTRTAGSWRCL